MFEEYIPDLQGAGRGDRGQIIDNITNLYGCSKDKVYRELKKAGWTSGRKRRSDAGEVTVSNEALEALGARLLVGVRKNGKCTTDIPTARHELELSGYHFGVSNGRLASLLKERHLDLKTQLIPTPHTRLKSLHPNHVHQVDPSMCLLYYLPRGGQKIIEDDEAYKNKPFLEGKAHLKIWRYVLTDHYSSSICVRYFQRAGERMDTLWEFLLYAWSVKDDPAYCFHGVPSILLMDKGSANLGGGVVNGLNSLRVRQLTHAPGKPRVKGQVENANNLVEKLFESRLKTDPVKGVEELNVRASWWCASYNANLIDSYDSTLRRSKTSRLELWSRITTSQLKELPEEAKGLLVANSETRKVAGDLTVSFVHPKLKESRFYHVGGLEGIRPGMKVQVQPVLMDSEGTVRVAWKYQGEEFVHEVEPILMDEAGFWADAAVIGESYRSQPHTVVDKANQRLAEVIGDEKKPFAHLNNGQGLKSISGMTRTESSVIHMPRTGNVIDPSKASAAVINYVEAANRLKKKMSHWDKAYLKVIRDNFPNGVPERDLDSLAEALSGLGGADDIKECIG